MNLQEWAKKEVEIACERERKASDNSEGKWDYGCACYESALKAFNSLCEDGHSGMSIGLTKNILNRLIDGKPLTSIEDTEDIWNEVPSRGNEYKTYQCKRMSSLFKNVYPDGTVKYHDNDRFIIREISNPEVGWHNGFVRSIAEKYAGEIEMPYFPKGKPIDVYCQECLSDPKNGDFDTIAILYLRFPEGKKVKVNRYFKESNQGFVEIRINEWVERMTKSQKEKV